MTWLLGYKLDEGFHSQQLAVNYVVLCLIAKAEIVWSLCIDDRVSFVIPDMLPYFPTGWVTFEIFVGV